MNVEFDRLANLLLVIVGFTPFHLCVATAVFSS